MPSGVDSRVAAVATFRESRIASRSAGCSESMVSPWGLFISGR